MAHAHAETAADVPKPPGPDPEWASYDDERLLDLRIRDLGLRLDRTGLQPRLSELEKELAEKNLAFRPHFWLSDEWFTPDGVAGIAIPFYLAHPRLARLEQAQMLEVEGASHEWCLRILRHEAGHAIENAFGLRRRADRRSLFGSSSTPYPRSYVPRPYSRSYVVHLDAWYAQSHPDEDFAETFAVWLDPRTDWRVRYAGWPALRKLEFVDGLMTELAGARPPVHSRRTVQPVAKLDKTLRAHYRQRRRFYGVGRAPDFDRDLVRLFSDRVEHAQRPSAARLIERMRRDARRKVARWTGMYQYTVDLVVKQMIERCQALDLRVGVPEDEARAEFLVLLTAQAIRYMSTGRHRVPL
ncbi:MAG TPA: putative zinc-binding metallopeptidase [Vicinamibacteria bacterium]|nr:putative zinc-binding metallopeptidase [Vicinamibacteria bacterium]